MSEHEPFLARIRENPQDDTPRLVYADWLEEHNEPLRSEYLRTVYELTVLPEEAPQRIELVMRLLALIEHVDREWRLAAGRRFDVMMDGLGTILGKLTQSMMSLIGISRTTEPSETKAIPGVRVGMLREDVETFARSFLPLVTVRIVPALVTPPALSESSTPE